MAQIEFCETCSGQDYKKVFGEICDSLRVRLGASVDGTIAATELVEYPIKIADVWDESSAFEEALGFIADDSGGELGRTTVLDCGSVNDGERMWVFYGRSELAI